MQLTTVLAKERRDEMVENIDIMSSSCMGDKREQESMPNLQLSLSQNLRNSDDFFNNNNSSSSSSKLESCTTTRTKDQINSALRLSLFPTNEETNEQQQQQRQHTDRNSSTSNLWCLQRNSCSNSNNNQQASVRG